MYFPSKVLINIIILIILREVTETLSVLQDKAPNVEYHEVVKIFMEDLGHPPEF